MKWDYSKKEYNKQQKADPIWHLENLINYGLGKKKLDPNLLKIHLPKLKIPENRRTFLKLILWKNKS